MTYNCSIARYSFVKNAETPYRSVFTQDEYDVLVLLCKRVFGKDFTNGGGVRLDSCNAVDGKRILGLSRVRFYDFLLSNFALFNYDKLLAAADENQVAMLEKLMRAFQEDGQPGSVEEIAQRVYLANTVAVSLLVKDKNDTYLLTKRGNNVGISNGFVSVTVTGAVDSSDLDTADPLRFCCQRELMEEMNYSIDCESIQPIMIVCGEKKLQPIVLANAVVDDLHTIVHEFSQHKGFAEENCGYAICTVEDIHRILDDSSIRLTEAARTHLESVL